MRVHKKYSCAASQTHGSPLISFEAAVASGRTGCRSLSGSAFCSGALARWAVRGRMHAQVGRLPIGSVMQRAARAHDRLPNGSALQDSLIVLALTVVPAPSGLAAAESV
jgi:hypothetical protein